MQPSFLRRVLRPLAGLALLLLVPGCESFDQDNPLIGRWTLTAPVASGIALGSYEFRRSSVSGFGIDQEVDYAIDDDTVTVIPRSFGPTFEVEMIDRNTARLEDPLTGGLLTLRRVR